MITRLGGLVLSLERGHSFVIQRLEPDASGKPRWSGPCFGSISNFGVGLTAGHNFLPTILQIHILPYNGHERNLTCSILLLVCAFLLVRRSLQLFG